MDERYLPLLIISLAIFVIALLFFGLFPLFQRLYVKKNFIEAYGKTIYNIALKEDYYLINTLLLERADGTRISIDHFLAGNKYLYIIKDKFFDGAITGEFIDPTWLLYQKKGKAIKKRKFDNPLLMNKARIEKMLQITNLDPSLIISIVLINDDAIIDKPLIHKDYDGVSFLVKRRDLKKVIRKIENRDISALNEKELKHIVHDIAKLNANKDGRIKDNKK